MDGLNFVTLATGVTCENINIDENGRTGSETTYTYSGTYSALKVQQSLCRNWGAYSLALGRQSGGSMWRLNAQFPFNEYNTDVLLYGVYELDVEMNQPSVFENLNLRSLLPDNYIAAVGRVINNMNLETYPMTSTVGGVPVYDGG